MSIRMYHPQDLFNIIPGEYTISGDVSLADDEIYHVTITEAEYHNPEALSDEYANVDYLDMLPTQNGDGSIVYNIHKEMVE